MKSILPLVLLASLAAAFPAWAAKSVLSCLLYTGGDGIRLKETGDGELTAKSKGVEITITSMGGNSFDTFQAILSVPKLSDIRAYGTKLGLAPLRGSVVEYLNHSRNNAISLTCEISR